MPELTRREQVIGIAAVVVLIAIFLPWQSVSLPSHTYHFDGWTTGRTGWIGALLLSAAGEYLIARRLEYRLWAPRFGASRVAAAAAVIGLALVIVRLATLPTVPGIHSSPSYGLWIALVAGVIETTAAIDEARRPPASD